MKFAVVHATFGSSTGTQDITSSGFGTPIGCIVLTTNATSSDTETVNARGSIGFTDGTTHRVCVVYDQDAVSSSNAARRTTISGSTLGGLITSSVWDYQFSFDSWITDGIRINVTDALASSVKHTFILIGGTGSVYVNHQLIGSSASDITSVGFQPDTVLMMGTGSPDGSLYSHAIFSLGASDGTNQRYSGLCSEDALNPTDAHTMVRNNTTCGQVYNNTETYTISVDSFDSSGFTATPSATANDYVVYMALDTDGQGVAIGSIDSPTSAAADWTSPDIGFQPAFLLLGLVENTSENTIFEGLSQAFTVSDGSTHGTWNVLSRDNTSPSRGKTQHSENPIRWNASVGGGNQHTATGLDFTSTGWEIVDADISSANSTARKWWYLAIEGESRFSNAAVGGKRQQFIRNPLLRM